jgi:hypothetical protein
VENVVPDEEEQPDRFLSGFASLTEFGRALGQAQSNQVRNTGPGSGSVIIMRIRFRIREQGN